jgi:6,7-dimethyl-8-ribityllumazine synthase
MCSYDGVDVGDHDSEYICEAVTQGITRVGLDTGRPVIFGVLTCLTEQQALDRAGLSAAGHNHGTGLSHTFHSTLPYHLTSMHV